MADAPARRVRKRPDPVRHRAVAIVGPSQLCALETEGLQIVEAAELKKLDAELARLRAEAVASVAACDRCAEPCSDYRSVGGEKVCLLCVQRELDAVRAQNDRLRDGVWPEGGMVPAKAVDVEHEKRAAVEIEFRDYRNASAQAQMDADRQIRRLREMVGYWERGNTAAILGVRRTQVELVRAVLSTAEAWERAGLGSGANEYDAMMAAVRHWILGGRPLLDESADG